MDAFYEPDVVPGTRPTADGVSLPETYILSQEKLDLYIYGLTSSNGKCNKEK